MVGTTSAVASNPEAKSFPFSVLVRQRLLLKERFGERYPNAWLVWEAGPWTPAVDPGGSVAQTRTPDRFPMGPTRADPLCFDLRIVPGQKLTVGRAPENGVVIDDATFSRHQLVIERMSPSKWIAFAAPEAGPTEVLGVPLPAEGMALSPGVMLHVGDVSLTFHTGESFANLVGASAAKTA
jgi:hypothetical protein